MNGCRCRQNYSSRALNTLALKLALTPVLMTGATLAVRRWGPAVGGWIVGLPLTSGPISFFLALERGPDFATRAAVSTILGINAVAATVVTYALLARRWHWAATTGISILAFFVVAGLLYDVHPSSVVAFVCTTAVLLLSLAALPRATPRTLAGEVPSFDLPLRIAVALAMVLTITAAAERLGPELSGLMSPFPVFTLVMAVFSHRQSGGAVAVSYSRGLLTSLFGFAVFFLVLTLFLPSLGLAAFAGATVTSLIASAVAALAAGRMA